MNNLWKLIKINSNKFYNYNKIKKNILKKMIKYMI